MMADAVRFARHKGILCQGRGSAANSAVAFCLGITAVDPVKHGLLFERFLSEARVDGKSEPPDIDVDFEHERREEVLDYMYANYDRAHAAITAVTQCFHAPTAVQDAMRALGYPAAQAFEISKRVHGARAGRVYRGGAARWRSARQIDLREPARPRRCSTALEGFEGLARLRSTHVGGFVLSAAAARELSARRADDDGAHDRPVRQGRSRHDRRAEVRLPRARRAGDGAHRVRRASSSGRARGRRCTRFPIGRRKTYELIQRGETIGTFQIESRAQINSILHTKPDHLYDIVVQVALIRPGPIQASVRPSVHGSAGSGTEPVTYPHPDLEAILARTQGIPIFQEQAMAIAMTLGGYTGARGRRVAPHDGQHPEEGAARGGARASRRARCSRARRRAEERWRRRSARTS